MSSDLQAAEARVAAADDELRAALTAERANKVRVRLAREQYDKTNPPLTQHEAWKQWVDTQRAQR